MNKLNLCIDIDGTITEPYDWLTRANEYFRTDIIDRDVHSYEIHSVLGVKREDYEQFYSLYGELIHLESSIRHGASDIISKLQREHNIHFVTARESRMKDVTLKWFDRHSIASPSLRMLGSHDKVNEAEALLCDIFIEDRYENAVQLSSAGFEVLLIDCNYNRGPLPSNVMRVNDWFEIDNIVKDRALQKYEKFKIAT